MLLITEQTVRSLLPMPRAIALMRMAFERWAAGEAQNQPRRRLILPTGSVLHSMAGAVGPYFGTKIYSTNPRHGAHFLVSLYDAATAAPLALIEANALGQIRTGAASGYAAELFAAPDAPTLGIIGSGFQAQTQVEAIRAVRPIREVRVWSRNPDKARAFANAMDAHAVNSAEQAVRDAAIVVTATNAREPVLDSDWVRDGTLVCAMGSNAANRRELPTDLVQRAVVYADSIEQARTEAGDIILAYGASADWPNVHELRNAHPGHDASRVTIFKSLGLGLEDVAAAGFVYSCAAG